MFRLGHLSDWHATSPDGAPIAALSNKRFFGWLSWKLRRRRVHRPEVLRALFEDIADQAPDHVAITGDLTNLSLEHEFETAARWLGELGSPKWVSLVPGNHDAYVEVPLCRSWDRWAPFMLSDDGLRGEGRAPDVDDYPTLRVRGEVALVGLCSACPTPVFRATGRLGGPQLARLTPLLRELRERDLYRVILLHHPPLDGDLAPRRRLVDSAALRNVLAREGAELLLHGHLHRTSFSEIPGPEGAVPVVGVRSSSNAGPREHRKAQYHLYQIERRGDTQGSRRFSTSVAIRGYDSSCGRFVPVDERSL